MGFLIVGLKASCNSVTRSLYPSRYIPSAFPCMFKGACSTSDSGNALSESCRLALVRVDMSFIVMRLRSGAYASANIPISIHFSQGSRKAIYLGGYLGRYLGDRVDFGHPKHILFKVTYPVIFYYSSLLNQLQSAFPVFEI